MTLNSVLDQLFLTLKYSSNQGSTKGTTYNVLNTHEQFLNLDAFNRINDSKEVLNEYMELGLISPNKKKDKK